MENKRTLVSVVIPAHNAERYLAETIQSALNQTYPEIEIVVVDDGSTDDTLKIAQSFEETVAVYLQEKQGPSVARNNGVKFARGEWIAFLDADDIWEPEKVEIQMNLASEYYWSHADYVFFGDGHDESVKGSDICLKHGGSVFPKLAVENFIATSTVMIKKNVFLESGGFEPALKSIQDWDLWLRIAAKYELGYISQVLGKYRVHQQSISCKTRFTLPNHLKVINRTFRKGGVGEKFMYLKSQALANSYSVCSMISENTGDISYSLYCALQSLRCQPTKLYRWRNVLRILFKELPLHLLKRRR